MAFAYIVYISIMNQATHTQAQRYAQLDCSIIQPRSKWSIFLNSWLHKCQVREATETYCTAKKMWSVFFQFFENIYLHII